MNSGCAAAHSLVARWVSTCVRDHEDCRNTKSGVVIDEGEEPFLPTRIIDVGSYDGLQAPRLVETNGAKGHYTALSHCWGTKQQFTTTRETLHERLQGISWKSLPKTFQDAITTTRAIGLQYIWIDLICIIQGDKEDWLRESPRIGTLYEGARLVIAASHARDGNEGCFFERDPPSQSICVSYINSHEESAGSIYIALDDKKEESEAGDPQKGPLSTQARITQEWLLARRMVFYTKSRLSWSCKTLQTGEEGHMFRSILEDHKPSTE
jgi:hypothetical protein